MTLEEANTHYRNGNGAPLYVDASKINLASIDESSFKGVNKPIVL